MNMAEQAGPSNGPSTSTLEPVHPDAQSFKVYKPAGLQTGPTLPSTHLIQVERLDGS